MGAEFAISRSFTRGNSVSRGAPAYRMRPHGWKGCWCRPSWDAAPQYSWPDTKR
jgi:uncharacterized protein (DUF2237 family)